MLLKCFVKVNTRDTSGNVYLKIEFSVFMFSVVFLIFSTFHRQSNKSFTHFTIEDVAVINSYLNDKHSQEIKLENYKKSAPV